MHEYGAIGYKEAAAMEDRDRSPIEAALERLHGAQEGAEKALTFLRERVESVVQPEEPSPELTTLDGAMKSSAPRSPVVRRIENAADDLDRLAQRIHGLVNRLDT